MIFNFFTYLLLSALAAGVAFAVLLNTIRNPLMKKMWQFSSIPFLVLLIISLAFIVVGFVVADIGRLSFMSVFLFYTLFFALSSGLYFFIRYFAFLIIFPILVIIAFIYYFALSGLDIYTFGDTFIVKVLNVNEDLIYVEYKDFNDEINFQSIEGDIIYPLFAIFKVPDCFFFLESSVYWKFAGFEVDENVFFEKQSILSRQFIRYKLPGIVDSVSNPIGIKPEPFTSFSIYIDGDGMLYEEVQK